jgi:hypothetical protein
VSALFCLLSGEVLIFKILTALKGWVGHAPQGRGALHIIIIICLFSVRVYYAYDIYLYLCYLSAGFVLMRCQFRSKIFFTFILK